MTSPQHQLTRNDIGQAAPLLRDAFFDNPAHLFIYPNEETRAERLLWLMRTNLNAQFDVGQSFAEMDTDQSITAMGFWHPPGAQKATLTTLARYGFFSMPLRHGFGAFKRMLTTVSEIEQARDNALNGVDSWYLNNMVVATSARGKGAGTRLLMEQLHKRVDPSGAPASLSTQRPENVGFYEKLGFKVACKHKIGGANGFRNWIMVYS